MKFLLTLVFSLLPQLAFAEATAGYNYGEDLVVIAVIIAAVVFAGIFAIAVLISKRKSR